MVRYLRLMMTFPTFIKSCFLVMSFYAVNLVAEDMPFISMAGDCRYPTVVAEGNTLYMIWLVAEGRNANLYFRQSNDEGNLWSSKKKISNENSDCYPPSLAVNAKTVHISWIDFGETIDGEIYYARSTDGGDTWEKNRILVEDANSARYPLLTCSEKNVYLIWQDVQSQVFFKASRDQGVSWEKEVLIGKIGKHSCYCFPPAITGNRKDLLVVWTDYREDKHGFKVIFNGFPLFKGNNKKSTKMVSSVVCRRSTDNGRTWKKEEVISATRVASETTDEIDNPMMLSDRDNVYLFWLDKRNLPLGEIFYARFNPENAKYPISGKALYTTKKRSPKRPWVVFDKENNLHFSWATFFGGKSIVHYGAVDSRGNTLSEKKDLTSAIGRYHNPIITRTPSGWMHIFWFDEPKDKDKWSRIFMKTSKDNGMTWEDWIPEEKEG